MSYTKCVTANAYKTGNYVTGAMPNGVFQTYNGITQTPNTSSEHIFASNENRSLLSPGVSYVLTTSGTSANQALTDGVKALTIYARNNDAYIQVGNGSQTASATSMFVGVGDRVDIDISKFQDPNIAVINGPTAAVSILQITELS